MARRLFSTQIVDSDAFLDMPSSAQNLYFHLGMRADDDGFIDNPKKILRMCGANEDDLKVLLSKRFVLAFESGVVVIKHWLIHNSIRKDRYNPTQYLEEKSKLRLKDNKSYTDDIKVGLPLGNQTATQVKLSKGKVSKDKIILTSNKVVGNDIELLTNYFMAIKGIKGRRSRYFRSAGEVLTLCGNSLEVAKGQVGKTKDWAEKEGLEWEMETVVKKYLELK